MSTFALRIKEERKKRYRSRKAAAEAFGISAGAWANWELGRTDTNPDTLIRLAAFFGVTVGYLVGSEEAHAGTGESMTREAEPQFNVPPRGVDVRMHLSTKVLVRLNEAAFSAKQPFEEFIERVITLGLDALEKEQ